MTSPNYGVTNHRRDKAIALYRQYNPRRFSIFGDADGPILFNESALKVLKRAVFEVRRGEGRGGEGGEDVRAHL